ncbi:MAG: 3-hydroxyacyl-CoA dehydrogenase / enoyl-CoA hydratase / 3-hydroxybutyryl-CoA epimerase [Pseudomonadota bacterium]|nr:3-hydroxyacyl-CoA dehydrogenase / enoyl-CoA hydratase / 3-hydroxybutyryl-CoA epimerase [Pseudomonadota bacterium]
MMMTLNLQHWRVETDAEGIAWATLDKAGESANSLSKTVMDELGQMLDAFDRTPPKAVIFRSGKEAGFIAGADIQEFTQLDTAE